MPAEFPRCPFCDSSNVRWIIYGFPTSVEDRYLKLGKAILGGPDFLEPRATYYCEDCKKPWLDPDDLVEYIEPTEKRPACHFCLAILRPDERLRYEIDAEEYKELILARIRDEVPARTFLQPETFADRPYPVCDRCRSGIHDNEHDRQTEEAEIEKKGRLAKIAMAVAVMAIVIYLIAEGVLHNFLRK